MQSPSIAPSLIEEKAKSKLVNSGNSTTSQSADLGTTQTVVSQSAAVSSINTSVSISAPITASQSRQQIDEKQKSEQQFDLQCYLDQAIKDGASKLYLSYKRITSSGTMAIADALQNPDSKFTSIDLSNNYIGSKGAATIATALQKPNKLTSINLRGNGIDSDGAIALAEALENSNCNLRFIYISWNNIGPEGAIALAKVIPDFNCKLSTIDLIGNNIGLKGAQALFEAFMLRRTESKPIDIRAENSYETLVAKRLMVVEPDLKQTLQILLQELRPQNAAQKVQQLLDLVTIVAPPFGQVLDEAQLKEINTVFGTTLASIKDVVPHKAALLEAEFNANKSRLICSSAQPSGESLAQAAEFALQAAQILKAINPKSTKKISKLSEVQRLIDDIYKQMRELKPNKANVIDHRL